MEEEVGMNHNMDPISRAKKRFRLTTQLLQQVIRPTSTPILLGNARLHGESSIFSVCRLAFGDVCSLACHSHLDPVTKDKPLKKFKASGSIVDKQDLIKTMEKLVDKQDLIKTMEKFNQRKKLIENGLLRLEKLSPITETMVEIKDQETYSIITRFAKFHNKRKLVSSDDEATSDSGATRGSLKSSLQRYVVAHPMPRDVPDETKCISL